MFLENIHVRCRPKCAACCTAPSINTPLPGLPSGMPEGKPAGVRCVQLADDDRCAIFGRPASCGSLLPSDEMYGGSREEAMVWLDRLERETRPSE
jgi:Fe-S-cluster containining protein